MPERLRTHCQALVEKWECELLEFNGEADHVHLLLSLNPKVAPSVFVNNLKTVTSRYIFTLNYQAAMLYWPRSPRALKVLSQPPYW